MAVKPLQEDTQNRISEQIHKHPPSFDTQVKKQAFKRSISLVQRVKNFISKKDYFKDIEESSLNSRNVSIVEVDEIEMIHPDEFISSSSRLVINDDSMPSTKPIPIKSNLRKNLIVMLNGKYFSESQAKSIINKHFKNCKSYSEILEVFHDIPEKEIYDKGYHSKKAMEKELKKDIEYIISLGYNEPNTKEEVYKSLNQAVHKKEFNTYVNSIPLYTAYTKGFINNADLEKTKKKALNKLLKLGYPKNHAEDIIRENFNEANSKDDFLKAINDTPHIIMYKQEYKTIGEYSDLRKQCIATLESLGYTHKQAVKTAIKEQKHFKTKQDFVSYIKINTPSIK